MNPSNAMNVVVTNDILPTAPTTPTTPIPAAPTIDTAPVIIISPEILKALQSYVVNNFPDIGLSQDIQQVAKEFFANLPPLIPISPTNDATVTSVTIATSTTS